MNPQNKAKVQKRKRLYKLSVQRGGILSWNTAAPPQTSRLETNQRLGSTQIHFHYFTTHIRLAGSFWPLQTIVYK